MKHLKTFENIFTNIFKSKDIDAWESFEEDDLEKNLGYNMLMQTANYGNLKRFEYLLPYYIKKINDTFEKKNILIIVVKGDADLYEKKKMIELLLDTEINYTFTFEGKTFYDFITNEKLKKWFDKKYPDIVKKLIFYKNTEKYNI